MAWATVGDVQVITGTEVTVDQLAVAQSVIEVYANRSPDTPNLSPRDLRTLQLATSWQAAWYSQQVGFEQRSAFGSMQQDGMGVVNFGQPEWYHTLAPMAARALKNLSWKASRSQRVPNARVLPGQGAVDFALESSDASTGWGPL